MYGSAPPPPGLLLLRCLHIRWNTSSCVWYITSLCLGKRQFLSDETLFIFALLLFDIRWNTEPLSGYLRRNRSSDYLRLKRLSHCHSSHLVRWRQWKLSKNVLLTDLEFLLRLLTGCFFNFLVSVVYVASSVSTQNNSWYATIMPEKRTIWCRGGTPL